MARTLSRIAKTKLFFTSTVITAIASPGAWGQSDVNVAPATKVVENPFSPNHRPSRESHPVAAPIETANEPKTYQNPFAARAESPRVLTPMPTHGSLSRWRRPLELPGIQAAARNTAPPAEIPWDVLTPDALGEQAVAEPPQQPAEIEMRPRKLARIEAPAPMATATPPDPSRFAPSSLHQPYWLLPDPTVPDESAAQPAQFVRLPEPEAHVAAPTAVDPFEEPAGESVVISDDAPQTPQTPPRRPDPSRCYADAERAAATASTGEELLAVVQLCKTGLASQPQGELGHSLRALAAWASNRRGELKSDDGREDEALREFEFAIQFDPSCWLALHNRGVSRAQQGQAEGALQDFNRAIELNPGHAVAYRNRGELLAAMGRTEEAAADYGRAMEQLPNDPDLLLMRGHALHRLGRYHESLADLSQSIELAPRNAEAFAYRGNVHAELGEFSRAMNDFQQSLRLDPESPDAYRSLAWLMATCPDVRFRDAERALAAAQRAENLAPPGDCFVLDALAAAHANAGQFEQAVRYQKEAVAVAPADFQQSFAGRLALYQHREPYRNGRQRAANRDVRAASLDASTREQFQQ